MLSICKFFVSSAKWLTFAVAPSRVVVSFAFMVKRSALISVWFCTCESLLAYPLPTLTAPSTPKPVDPPDLPTNTPTLQLLLLLSLRLVWVSVVPSKLTLLPSKVASFALIFEPTIVLSPFVARTVTVPALNSLPWWVVCWVWLVETDLLEPTLTEIFASL